MEMHSCSSFYYLLLKLCFVFSLQFLDVVRNFDGYGAIQFPHCSCDARKDGPIKLSISLKHLRLKAVDQDGMPLVSRVIVYN